MAELRLPARGRPNYRYKKCGLGVDLPAQFIADLQALDPNLWPIFHPYKILWDNFVNCDLGPLDDPRHNIVENSGRYCQMVMGHVLTNGKGEPLLDGAWHIWRWCEGVSAWAHIVRCEVKDPLYLTLLVRTLYLQDQFTSKYGHAKYQRMLSEVDEQRREKIMSDREDLMGEIHKANSGMMRRVMDNFERGHVAPTNPKKEIITSAAGISHRSKIVRPLSDREGGLILPDGFGEE